MDHSSDHGGACAEYKDLSRRGFLGAGLSLGAGICALPSRAFAGGQGPLRVSAGVLADQRLQVVEVAQGLV